MVEPWVKPVLLLGKPKKWFYGTYIPFGTKIVFSVIVKEPAKGKVQNENRKIK